MVLTFGTDGVRGRAFEALTEEFVQNLGYATTVAYPTDALVVGRDTRESGPALLEAFARGCAANGVRIVDLGVAPTPAVAWYSRTHDIPAAVLSASHNVWSDNGVKVFAPGGKKLGDAEQHKIEDALAAMSNEDASGGTPIVEAGDASGYVDSVVDSVGGRSFTGCNVVLDCANGAATSTAPEIFRRLGANLVVIAADPNGRNINEGVGSTHPDKLVAAVREHDADFGFAFDGDADRVIACGSDGQLLDGDQMIAISAIDRQRNGRLAADTVIVTVMANLGFRKAMTNAGIDLVETPVGDRHVLEALDAGGFVLGGEQSGHIIHRDLATTGDGALAAVQLLDATSRNETTLSAWGASVMERYPQILENVRSERPIENLDARIEPAVRREEAFLGDQGRVLIRASGTEPVVRVMVEAAHAEMAAESVERLVNAVEALAQGQ